MSSIGSTIEAQIKDIFKLEHRGLNNARLKDILPHPDSINAATELLNLTISELAKELHKSLNFPDWHADFLTSSCHGKNNISVHAINCTSRSIGSMSLSISYWHLISLIPSDHIQLSNLFNKTLSFKSMHIDLTHLPWVDPLQHQLTNISTITTIKVIFLLIVLFLTVVVIIIAIYKQYISYHTTKYDTFICIAPMVSFTLCTIVALIATVSSKVIKDGLNILGIGSIATIGKMSDLIWGASALLLLSSSLWVLDRRHIL